MHRILATTVALVTVTHGGGASADDRDAGLEPAATDGLAVGIEVGQPTSATVRYALPRSPLGLGAAVGSGLFGGRGLHLHADATYTALGLAHGSRSIYLGIGARYYQHGYALASVDELPDTHIGVRFSLGAAFRVSALELYGEAAPGYDVYRSDGCSLMSGAESLCPHTMSARSFVQLAVGARYYFGR